jgi:hypothetical protein
MNSNLSRAARGFLPLATIIMLTGGCATKKYTAERYKAAQDRFGTITLPTEKKLYLCPAIDGLPPECQQLFDPKFSPWAHATEAIEQELKVSGIHPVRPEFASGPSFDSMKRVISEKANKSENAVYLGVELLWMTQRQWSIDAKLFSPTGNVLFEKRGICVVLGLKKVDEQEAKNMTVRQIQERSKEVDTQEVTHMAIRQILADPTFKKALQ